MSSELPGVISQEVAVGVSLSEILLSESTVRPSILWIQSTHISRLLLTGLLHSLDECYFISLSQNCSCLYVCACFRPNPSSLCLKSHYRFFDDPVIVTGSIWPESELTELITLWNDFIFLVIATECVLPSGYREHNNNSAWFYLSKPLKKTISFEFKITPLSFAWVKLASEKETEVARHRQWQETWYTFLFFLSSESLPQIKSVMNSWLKLVGSHQEGSVQ